MAAKFKLPDWIHSITFGDGCGREHKPDKHGEVACDECAAAAPNHTFHNPNPPPELRAPEAEWPANATSQLNVVPTPRVAESSQPVTFTEREGTTVEELEAEIERLRAQVDARKLEPGEVPEVGGGGSLNRPASGGARVAPAVRAHAEKLGVDLDQVEGSGKGGAVTKKDVEAAAAAPATSGEEGEEA